MTADFSSETVQDSGATSLTCLPRMLYLKISFKMKAEDKDFFFTLKSLKNSLPETHTTRNVQGSP